MEAIVLILKGSLAVLYLKCLLTPGKDRILDSKSAFRKLCHSMPVLVFTLTIHQCITITYTSGFFKNYFQHKKHTKDCMCKFCVLLI